MQPFEMTPNNKPKAVAIVGARLNSSRLPGKHLKDISGQPLIQHVFERLARCQQLDQAILASTSDTFNQPLINWAQKANIPYVAYSADVNDLVGRIDAVVQRSNADIVVYICGDCPLIEPTFIDHAIHALQSEQTAEIVHLKPDVTTLHEGIDIYSRAGWDKLIAASNSPETREHVGLAAKQLNLLQPIFIDDSDDYSRIKHRISVDTVADLQFIKAVYERWYSDHAHDSIVDLKWLQNELINDPALRSINKHVHQKNPNKQYQSASLYCHANAQIGLGHLRRMTRISDALQSRLGIGTTIHINGQANGVGELETKHHWYSSEQELLNQLARDKAEFIFLDFHPDYIDLAAIKQLISDRKTGDNQKFIAIDKLSDLLAEVDLLFVPCFYSNIRSDKVSCGWDHYFIDIHPIEKRQKQICVLSGGSDALGFGEYLPELINTHAPNDWDLIWIQGPYANAPKIENHGRWQVKKNPAQLTRIIAESEIVVSAYGVSLFEAIANAGSVLLLPSDTICSQQELLALDKFECCKRATNDNQIGSALQMLCESEETRIKLRLTADSLFKQASAGEILCSALEKMR